MLLITEYITRVIPIICFPRYYITSIQWIFCFDGQLKSWQYRGQYFDRKSVSPSCRRGCHSRRSQDVAAQICTDKRDLDTSTVHGDAPAEAVGGDDLPVVAGPHWRRCCCGGDCRG